MYTIIVVFAILATAFSAEWVVDTSTQSGMIIGVGVGSKTSAIAAANSDSQGPIVTLYDGSKWSQKLGVVEVAMVMDGAISSDGKLAVYSSAGSIQVSTDNGESFQSTPGYIGMSQDVHLFGEGTMAAVGSFAVLPGNPSGQAPGKFSGMLISKDGAGKDWEMSTIPNEPYPRYGSFPSNKVWYASAGMWNTTTTEVSSELDSSSMHHMTHRLKLDKTNGKKSFYSSNISPLSSTDGWYGALYKTMDAGATWTNVYNSPEGETWYFNQISCPTVDVCIAVGEGQQGASPYAVALVTTDGGSTWKKTFESTDYPSLMSCEMTSATDGFIVPANNGRQTGSDFLSTTDGGNTWTLTQTLDKCYCMDVDSADGLGVASCLTQSSGAIAMYQ